MIRLELLRRILITRKIIEGYMPLSPGSWSSRGKAIDNAEKSISGWWALSIRRRFYAEMLPVVRDADHAVIAPCPPHPERNGRLVAVRAARLGLC